ARTWRSMPACATSSSRPRSTSRTRPRKRRTRSDGPASPSTCTSERVEREEGRLQIGPTTGISRPYPEDGPIMRRASIATAFALCLLCVALAHSDSFLQRRISDWLKDLNKGDKAAMRGGAAFALGRMGADAEEAIPDLASKAATDKDAGV